MHLIDQLEQRQLLAATVVKGLLTIEGSAGDDVITLSVDKKMRAIVDIQPEGFHQLFPILNGAMTGLLIRGNGGDDTINVDTTVSGPPGQEGITISGGDGNDTISSGVGDDTIDGDGGDDSIMGNEGNDVIDGGTGADFIDGGIGADTVDYSSRTAALVVKLDGKANDGEAGEHDFVVGVTNETLIGGSGNDRLDTTGDPSVHSLQGNGGNDTLIGGQNRDMIDGAAGNDSLVGNENTDSLTGGIGNDVLVGGIGADTFGGGDGVDRADYTGVTANVSIFLDGVKHSGAAGEKDLIRTDVENATGGLGNDRITGNSGRNLLKGGAGKDTILGLAGVDSLYGDAGDDSIDGGDGNDRIFGGIGADILHGGKNNDTITGDGGGDQLFGDAGVNNLNSKTGSKVVDTIFTASTTDVITRDTKDVVKKV